jgi:hypothetical protein
MFPQQARQEESKLAKDAIGRLPVALAGPAAMKKFEQRTGNYVYGGCDLSPAFGAE